MADSRNRNQYGRLEGEETLHVEFFNDQLPVWHDVIPNEIVGYRDEEFVKIQRPGVLGQVFIDVVDARHVDRFPREYEAFKAGQKLVETGTALEAIQGITPSQVKTLKQIGIVSVEALAKAPDSALQRVSMTAFKYKAVETLSNVAKTVVETQLAKRDEEIAELRAQVDKLVEMLQVSQAPKTRATKEQ